MFNTLFNKGSMPIAERWLSFTAARHTAIANNIANKETPQYLTKDLSEADFRKAMDRAMRERDKRRIPIFQLERARGIEPMPMGGIRFAYEESGDKTHLNHVENNVDIDIEMGKLLRNARMHNLMASILQHQFSLLREAISERVG